MIEINNRIYNNDFMDIIDQIPNNIFELIIIDPPYNKGKDMANDNMNNKKYEILFEKWISIICSKLKNNGSLYCFINEEQLWIVKKIIDKYLFFERNIIWEF